jgi:hypothetical protein
MTGDAVIHAGAAVCAAADVTASSRLPVRQIFDYRDTVSRAADRNNRAGNIKTHPDDIYSMAFLR